MMMARKIKVKESQLLHTLEWKESDGHDRLQSLPRSQYGRHERKLNVTQLYLRQTMNNSKRAQLSDIF